MSARQSEFAMEYLPAILTELRKRYDSQPRSESFPVWVKSECMSYARVLAPSCSRERLQRLADAIAAAA